MSDFDRVIEAYGPALRRLASAWERDAAAREDLLQEILFALWRALPNFRGDSSEKTFVFRVAHNRALTHRFRPKPETEALDAAADVIDLRPTPEAERSAAQHVERLLGALQSLPVAARQILTLSLEGLARAELAERGDGSIMSVHENEWESLAEAWRTAGDPIDTAPLRRKVAAHFRRLIAAAVAEFLLAAGFGWLSVIVAGDGVDPWEAVWLVTLWGFTIIAAGFAWWNRRGTWRALGESVEEFVRITRLRAERQMRSVYFVLSFFVAEAVIIMAQLAWFGRLTFFAGAFLASFGVLVAAWCWAMKKKVARDLAALDGYGGGAELLRRGTAPRVGRRGAGGR